MDRKFKWAVLTMMCLLMILALGKLSAEETKERLVLLPVGGENLSDADRSLFQTAIKEGLSKKYEIFSGEQVQAKLEKYSITSCTSDECLERIAIAFNGSLVGRGSVEKDGSGYFITIEIKDVITDKDVFNKTDGCNACTKTEIMQKLKALTSGGTVSASAPGAVEFASSAAPDKGPAEGAVTRITPKVSGDSGSTVAALFLDSEPSGAAVYLGDIVAGETPYQNLGLKAGQTLRVVLKKDDYHTQTIELKLSGGTNEIDTVKLKPRFGSLSVTSEPAGADVFLAGKKVGATPYKNAKVLSGTYLLSVRKDLYTSVENQTIQIMDEKATVKNVALQADFGTLDVASTPAGARAEVSRKSGKTVHEDKTPFSVRLSPGTYEVRLEKDGYDSVSYTVTVNRNGKQSIDAANAVLRRLEGTVIVSSEPYEKGAEVRVDGELKGHVPATLTVPAGEHEIAVKGKKLQGKQKIIVKDRETVTAQIKLKAGGDKFTNSIGMSFVFINPGTFMMGSPSSESGRDSKETLHQVTLTKGYFMQTTEVTQGQWKRVMGYNPSSFNNCEEDCPVEKVSWDEAQEFIRNLNQKDGQKRYRLPTEAEWEYACRAGSESPYANDNSLDAMGWYIGNSGNKTHPVAQKQPNAWGLYDMHGNVWEWCQDGYGDYSSGSVGDPVGASSDSDRVLRGGGWDCKANRCRSALRVGYGRNDWHISSRGFRLALSPGQ